MVWSNLVFGLTNTVLVLVVLNTPVTANVRFCYYNKEGNGNMMLNQSCVTGESHLDERFVSTDYLTSPDPSQSPTDTTDAQKSYVANCFVFRYISQQNLSSAVSARSSNASFGCDFQYWCSERATGFYTNVTLERHRGDLFCCDSNNCNSASVIPKLPMPQICYKNTHHWGHSVHIGTGTTTLCRDPDSWCIRSRLLESTQPSTAFDCDNQHRCQFFNMTSGSSLVCRNVSTGRGKEELCCCLGQTCFIPLRSRSEASTFGTFLPPDSGDDRGGRLNTVTVGCIIAFTLLALVGMSVMIGLMYQRRNHPDSSNLTLTYSRIEDDDMSDSVQML